MKLIIINIVIAQTVTITSINITPSNPTQIDSIELSVNSSFPCMDIVLRDSSISITDTIINILINFEGPGMCPLSTTKSTKFLLDPISPGSYRILCNVFWYYSSGFAHNFYDTSFVVNPYLSIQQNSNKYTPDEFTLNQNYPNPFNATTRITYELSRSNFVELTIYDLNGKVIQTIPREFRSSGIHSLTFDGHPLASGLYFYQLKYGSNKVKTMKMALMR